MHYTLSPADYAVIGVFLAVIAAIAVAYAKRGNDVDGYFLAGRSEGLHGHASDRWTHAIHASTVFTRPIRVQRSLGAASRDSAEQARNGIRSAHLDHWENAGERAY